MGRTTRSLRSLHNQLSLLNTPSTLDVLPSNFSFLTALTWFLTSPDTWDIPGLLLFIYRASIVISIIITTFYLLSHPFGMDLKPWTNREIAVENTTYNTTRSIFYGSAAIIVFTYACVQTPIKFFPEYMDCSCFFTAVHCVKQTDLTECITVLFAVIVLWMGLMVVSWLAAYSDMCSWSLLADERSQEREVVKQECVKAFSSQVRNRLQNQKRQFDCEISRYTRPVVEMREGGYRDDEEEMECLVSQYMSKKVARKSD